MIIGLDFDNTIAIYDNIFREFITENQLQNNESASDSPKKIVKNHFFSATEGNFDWTRFQAEVYGNPDLQPEINEYLVSIMVKLSAQGHNFKIISHKSIYPICGKNWNLRQKAKEFLERNRVLKNKKINLSEHDVFFEATEYCKIKRIENEGCHYFVDDLSSILNHNEFPVHCSPILFAEKKHKTLATINSFLSLPDIVNRNNESDLFKKHSIDKRTDRKRHFHLFLQEQAIDGLQISKSLTGGVNNELYLLLDKINKEYCGKIYKKNINDPRDRYHHEISFYKLFSHLQGKDIPELISYNDCGAFSLLEYVKHDSQKPITNLDWTRLVDFFVKIQTNRENQLSQSLPNASEGFETIKDHLGHLHTRRDLWLEKYHTENLPENLKDIVQNFLEPEFERISKRCLQLDSSLFNRRLSQEEKVISTSDFGMHNVIRTNDPQRPLVVIDFEYAGWDDPVKSITDFICQPNFTSPTKAIEYMIKRVLEIIPPEFHTNFQERFTHLFEILKLKWAYIILNPLLYNKSIQSNQQIIQECAAKISALNARLLPQF